MPVQTDANDSDLEPVFSPALNVRIFFFALGLAITCGLPMVFNSLEGQKQEHERRQQFDRDWQEYRKRHPILAEESGDHSNGHDEPPESHNHAD